MWLRRGTLENIHSCCLKALGEWNYLLFNNHIPKACRSIIQGKTLLWSKEEDKAPEESPMWPSQNSTELAADGWIRGVHKDHHIDYCGAEKFKKGAVWSIYTVGQSLASCCPERWIQIECEFLPCFCVYVTAHTVSFQNVPDLQLSLLSELRTPLWLAHELHCVCAQWTWWFSSHFKMSWLSQKDLDESRSTTKEKE